MEALDRTHLLVEDRRNLSQRQAADRVEQDDAALRGREPVEQSHGALGADAVEGAVTRVAVGRRHELVEAVRRDAVGAPAADTASLVEEPPVRRHEDPRAEPLLGPRERREIAEHVDEHFGRDVVGISGAVAAQVPAHCRRVLPVQLVHGVDVAVLGALQAERELRAPRIRHGRRLQSPGVVPDHAAGGRRRVPCSMMAGVGGREHDGTGALEEHDGRARTRTDWGRYGKKPIVLLALVAFIDSMDRGILPGVLDAVQDDFGFDDFEAGLLGTVFVLAGFLVVLPAGYLADRYPRTRIIAIVLASWGAISALNAIVQTYWQFLVVRATLGVGETIDNPASQSLIADYYPPAMRGRAYAFQRVAPTVGTALGTGIGGAVGAIFGWRWAFLVVGVPGSLLALAVWRMREPAAASTTSWWSPTSSR